jgi:hypothetical protein
VGLVDHKRGSSAKDVCGHSGSRDGRDNRPHGRGMIGSGTGVKGLGRRPRAGAGAAAHTREAVPYGGQQNACMEPKCLQREVQTPLMRAAWGPAALTEAAAARKGGKDVVTMAQSRAQLLRSKDSACSISFAQQEQLVGSRSRSNSSISSALVTAPNAASLAVHQQVWRARAKFGLPAVELKGEEILCEEVGAGAWL